MGARRVGGTEGWGPRPGKSQGPKGWGLKGGGPKGGGPKISPPFHTTARELQTCAFEGPGASNTTKIQREDPPREGEKERKRERERGKKSTNCGAVRRRGVQRFWGPADGGSGGGNEKNKKSKHLKNKKVQKSNKKKETKKKSQKKKIRKN